MVALGCAGVCDSRAIQRNESKWERARITRECAAGVSQAGAEQAKAGGLARSVLFIAVVGLVTAMARPVISECSLNDSTHSYTQHTQAIGRS